MIRCILESETCSVRCLLFFISDANKMQINVTETVSVPVALTSTGHVTCDQSVMSG